MIEIHCTATFDNGLSFHASKIYERAAEKDIPGNEEKIKQAMRTLAEHLLPKWGKNKNELTKLEIYYFNDEGEKIL